MLEGYSSSQFVLLKEIRDSTFNKKRNIKLCTHQSHKTLPYKTPVTNLRFKSNFESEHKNCKLHDIELINDAIMLEM